MSRKKNVPIAENKAVKELMALLKEHQAPGRMELSEAVSHVAEMEKQLAAAVNELKTMREDLQKIQSRPLQTSLRKTADALQRQVSSLRERLVQLKQGIVVGCKNALADFRENGVTALNGIARFFHIKPGLEAMRDHLNMGIAADEKAVSKIEAVSAEYHEAGRHLKNMGRALMGKEAVDEAKPMGKLGKTIAAPYRAEITCLRAMRGSVEEAISSISKLERATEKKPSVLENMNETKPRPTAAKVKPRKIEPER